MFEPLHDRIWVKHNFLSEAEISEITNAISQVHESTWHPENDQNKQSYWYGRSLPTTLLQNYINSFEMQDIDARLKDEFLDYQNIRQFASLHRMLPDGNTLDYHVDNYNENDKTQVFGVVLYINDNYEGGMLHYKDIDFTYKPKSGDLVVHDAGILHGVLPVTKGVRYMFTSFVRGSDKTRLAQFESTQQ